MTRLALALAPRALVVLTALVALLGPAAPELDAQAFITGRVVDAQGVGVPGVDIDVLNNGSGGDPLVANDGTDASGFFTTTVTPAGIYDVRFTPPAPPVTTLLRTTVSDVVVVGTADMGTIQLPQGVRLQGRCINPSAFPVAGVNLDVLDGTGTKVDVSGAFTDLFGNFDFSVPMDLLEVRFDSRGVIGQTLAPKVMHVDTTSGLNAGLGDVPLEQGFHVVTTILQPGGLPLANTDTDTFDTATGEQIWTPGDNTNSSGQLDLVLGAGTWDVLVCPALTTGIAPVRFAGIPVFSDLNFGITNMPAGFLVQGTVRDSLGNPLAGIDVDANDVDGVEFTLCGDNTDANGQYQVVVPVGTFTIEFTPSYSLPFGKDVHDGVTSAQVLDGVLPDCPPFTPYGSGTAGTGGIVPTLVTAGGSARLGNDGFFAQLGSARGGARAVLLIGFNEASTPFHGGTILVGGGTPPSGGGFGAFSQNIYGKTGVGGGPLPLAFDMVFFRMPGPPGAAGAGSLVIPSPIPNNPVLAGWTRHAQLLVRDPQATGGWAMSNGIRIQFCE